MESRNKTYIEVGGFEPVTPSIIMVAGIGGAGGNAVNHMFDMGIQDVAFMVANTDKQALDSSLVPVKVQLGEGLGAGNRPEKGRAAAIASLDHISSLFKEHGTRMVFVTAGMGGGTGTGAAPVIAKAARDMGILTVAIVTMPYVSEGPMRMKNAMAGIDELKKNVDSLLIINNENIQEIYGELPITEAFGRANDILATAAKGIAEIITRPGIVNVDFADVTTVMKDSGIALMGSGRAHGENRVHEVAHMALASPLLNYNSLDGATSILFNISYGNQEITLAESVEILDYIQSKAGKNANVIWGANRNELLDDELELIIIATGFKAADEDGASSFQPIAERGGKKWRPTDPFAEQLGNKGRGGAAERSVANDIIEISENVRYKNIERILNEPAHIRRRMRLVNDAPGGSSKVRIKDDAPPPRKGHHGGRSLFED
ncbi:MAG: cell division protein FtsZ [Rikenellaceae bacterium]|nr:cell division protein FtsZ [Rikenellaceae bacterium]MCL2693072.1 cell division protein FtsZ [Rikenellaceae bacterium]